jgi:phosphoribosylformylglycinamidine (FGAM) synthase PurS component
MFWKIEVKEKRGIFDAVGEGVKKDILDLGIRSVSDVAFAQAYTITGALSHEQIRTICEALLADPVSQQYEILSEHAQRKTRKQEFIIEVAYNPGVMDPAEVSIL